MLHRRVTRHKHNACLHLNLYDNSSSFFFSSFFFLSNKVRGRRERKREGAGNSVTDRQNHPKENRQCCSPHYGFRCWYEPETQSGGHYIKPRSVHPGLISAVICVMARSMWMKSSGRLYYNRPSVKSRTKMRAVDRTLPGNCVRPTGWRAWFVQHAFKLENVLLSFLHPGTNVSTLAVLPSPWFFSPPQFFFFPLPIAPNPFSIPSARWQTLSSGRPCFLPVFPGFGGGWRGVKGERSALCLVLSRALSTQPLLCNTISPGSYWKWRWGAMGCSQDSH